MINKLLVMLLLIPLCMSADVKQIPMPDVISPGGIYLSNDYLYITQKHNIQIYSRKDYKLIKEFSRKGEGPGEFKFRPFLKVYNQHIMIIDFEKIMFFTPLGELKEEIKKPYDIFVKEELPGGEFLARCSHLNRDTGEEKIKFCIVSRDFKENKKLMEFISDSFNVNFETQTTTMKIPFESVNAVLYKNRIYIGNPKKGIYIEVFDLKGHKLYEINYPYRKRRIPGSYKKEYIMERQKKRRGAKTNGPFESEIEFRRHFPAYMLFQIMDDKILIHTYCSDYKIGIDEILHFDLKGNLKIKKKHEPTALELEVKKHDRQIGGKVIREGKAYWLIENEEEEMWELHIEEITE